MTAFGASISPLWYKDTSNHFYTKREMMNHLHRALVTVGMVPNDAMSTFSNFQNVTDAGFDAVQGMHIQVYDYPDTTAYTVAGVSYRPVLVMVDLHRTGVDWASSYGADTYQCNGIFVCACRRRADRSQIGDLTSLESTFPYYPQNYGLLYSTGYNDSWAGWWGHKSGGVIRKDHWLPTTTAAVSVPSAVNRLNVNNIHVILNSSGLFVFVGTHSARKQECGNLMSFGCVFHGDRIPNRGIPPISDVNLGGTDPVLYIPFDTSYSGTIYTGPYTNGNNQKTNGYMQYGTYFNQREVAPASWALGAQYAGAHNIVYSSALAVRMILVSVDALDYSVLTDFNRTSIPILSPRVISGGGYNILNRVCAFSWQVTNQDGTKYVGPIDIALRPEPQPRWSDMWFLSGFRFSDQYASVGEYIDAATSKHWWMQYAFNTQQMYAIDVTGITKLSSLSI